MFQLFNLSRHALTSLVLFFPVVRELNLDLVELVLDVSLLLNQFPNFII